MMAAVPEADVVITNPTHFAVALKYDPAGGGAPLLLAKGNDFLALKIREVAQEHKVMVMESPALARAVYYSTELDQEIPAGSISPWPRCWPMSTSSSSTRPARASGRAR